MGHVGGKPHHHHDEKPQTRQAVREHVANEFDDVEVVVAGRQRLFGKERAEVEKDGASEHEGAARKENERSVLALENGPTDDNKRQRADENADHGGELREKSRNKDSRKGSEKRTEGWCAREKCEGAEDAREAFGGKFGQLKGENPQFFKRNRSVYAHGAYMNRVC